MQLLPLSTSGIKKLSAYIAEQVVHYFQQPRALEPLEKHDTLHFTQTLLKWLR